MSNSLVKNTVTEPPTIQIGMRLSPRVIRQLDAIAAAEGRTRSKVIWRLLEEALEARAKRKLGK